MADLIFIGALALMAALSYGLIELCDRLIVAPKDRS
jgi:hypothetical protein